MITCYLLMLINFINLSLTGLSGYFHFEIMGANHFRFALFTILIFSITETVVMYFFITTGKAIKSALDSGFVDKSLWKRERKLKMVLFPQLMLTILLVGGWFIHIGAVENKLSPNWIHATLFIIAFVHHTWLLKIKNNAFKEQLSIINELESDEDLT